MKKIVISVFISILIFGCKTEQKKEGNRIIDHSTKIKEGILKVKKIDSPSINNNDDKLTTLQDSAKYLKKYIKLFNKKRDSISEDKFFTTFPSTFSNFNKLYGFSKELGESPMYNDYHLITYNSIRKHITDIKYFNKLINLSLYGHWEADNISTLQKVLNDNFIDNPKLFITLLKKKKKSEVESFWFFFFDGPHPKDKEVVKIYNTVINELDKDMIPVVKKAYLKVQTKELH